MPRKAKSGKTSVPAKPSSSECVFCSSEEDNEEIYGKLLKKSGITIHYFCMLFSSGLWQRGKRERDGILGFLPEDILREQKRGNRLTCQYCRRKGATIGCVLSQCRKTYHFRCGKDEGVLFQFFDEFRSYCPDHRPCQETPTSDRLAFYGTAKSTCSICLLSVETRASNDTLRSPCCRKAWFHRSCVQRYAVSAGAYFFKCPLCNDKELFEAEMLQFGIYIPEQDAAWEQEPSAFQELLERYCHCDAAECRCPHGREYSGPSGSRWEMALCDMCGSSGTHTDCHGFKKIAKENLCQDCAEILENQKKKKHQSSAHPQAHPSPQEIHQRLEKQRSASLRAQRAALRCSRSSLPNGQLSASPLSDRTLAISSPVIHIGCAKHTDSVHVMDRNSEQLLNADLGKACKSSSHLQTSSEFPGITQENSCLCAENNGASSKTKPAVSSTSPGVHKHEQVLQVTNLGLDQPQGHVRTLSEGSGFEHIALHTQNLSDPKKCIEEPPRKRQLYTENADAPSPCVQDSYLSKMSNGQPPKKKRLHTPNTSVPNLHTLETSVSKKCTGQESAKRRWLRHSHGRKMSNDDNNNSSPPIDSIQEDSHGFSEKTATVPIHGHLEHSLCQDNLQNLLPSERRSVYALRSMSQNLGNSQSISEVDLKKDPERDYLKRQNLDAHGFSFHVNLRRSLPRRSKKHVIYHENRYMRTEKTVLGKTQMTTRNLYSPSEHPVRLTRSALAQFPSLELQMCAKAESAEKTDIDHLHMEKWKTLKKPKCVPVRDNSTNEDKVEAVAAVQLNSRSSQHDVDKQVKTVASCGTLPEIKDEELCHTMPRAVTETSLSSEDGTPEEEEVREAFIENQTGSPESSTASESLTAAQVRNGQHIAQTSLHCFTHPDKHANVGIGECDNPTQPSSDLFTDTRGLLSGVPALKVCSESDNGQQPCQLAALADNTSMLSDMEKTVCPSVVVAERSKAQARVKRSTNYLSENNGELGELSPAEVYRCAEEKDILISSMMQQTSHLESSFDSICSSESEWTQDMTSVAGSPTLPLTTVLSTELSSASVFQLPAVVPTDMAKNLSPPQPASTKLPASSASSQASQLGLEASQSSQCQTDPKPVTKQFTEVALTSLSALSRTDRLAIQGNQEADETSPCQPVQPFSVCDPMPILTTRPTTGMGEQPPNVKSHLTETGHNIPLSPCRFQPETNTSPHGQHIPSALPSHLHSCIGTNFNDGKQSTDRAWSQLTMSQQAHVHVNLEQASAPPDTPTQPLVSTSQSSSPVGDAMQSTVTVAVAHQPTQRVLSPPNVKLTSLGQTTAVADQIPQPALSSLLYSGLVEQNTTYQYCQSSPEMYSWCVGQTTTVTGQAPQPMLPSQPYGGPLEQTNSSSGQASQPMLPPQLYSGPLEQTTTSSGQASQPVLPPLPYGGPLEQTTSSGQASRPVLPPQLYSGPLGQNTTSSDQVSLPMLPPLLYGGPLKQTTTSSGQAFQAMLSPGLCRGPVEQICTSTMLSSQLFSGCMGQTTIPTDRLCQSLLPSQVYEGPPVRPVRFVVVEQTSGPGNQPNQTMHHMLPSPLRQPSHVPVRQPVLSPQLFSGHNVEFVPGQTTTLVSQFNKPMLPPQLYRGPSVEPNRLLRETTTPADRLTPPPLSHLCQFPVLPSSVSRHTVDSDGLFTPLPQQLCLSPRGSFSVGVDTANPPDQPNQAVLSPQLCRTASLPINTDCADKHVLPMVSPQLCEASSLPVSTDSFALLDPSVHSVLSKQYATPSLPASIGHTAVPDQPGQQPVLSQMHVTSRLPVGNGLALSVPPVQPLLPQLYEITNGFVPVMDVGQTATPYFLPVSASAVHCHQPGFPSSPVPVTHFGPGA